MRKEIVYCDICGEKMSECPSLLYYRWCNDKKETLLEVCDKCRNKAEEGIPKNLKDIDTGKKRAIGILKLKFFK